LLLEILRCSAAGWFIKVSSGLVLSFQEEVNNCNCTAPINREPPQANEVLKKL
jgi:hypothetical protein